MVSEEKISRHDFLKFISVTGGAIMFIPLMKFRKVFGANATSSSTANTLDIKSKVGPDGVSFLYPTKPGGFVWYMNEDKPLDSHLEIGGGSTYKKLVKNKDGSCLAAFYRRDFKREPLYDVISNNPIFYK